MNELLTQAATRVGNPAIDDWKKQGKKVVGTVCSHVPEEVLTAAGIASYRLRGIDTTSTSIGDTYFGPFVCSCPKAILQNAGEGKFSFLDGAVMVQACDSMRRLDECWRKAGEDYEGAMPDYFYYFGVPHKVSEYSINWFTEEIERFVKSLEEHFNVSITPESLSEAVALHNRERSLLADLEDLRAREDAPVTGTEAMTLVLAGTALPTQAYISLLEEALDEMRQRTGENGKRKRIMLAGSVVDDLALVEALEDEGALVVTDNVCFGARAHEGEVDAGQPGYKGLATRYLHEQLCPRMFGYYRQRFDLLTQKIEKARVDGVVFQNIRFCDLHGSENGLMERDLENMGIPAIRIEREYGAMADEGRVRMRVGAFLESINQGR
ncbi:MAG: 2-hydroxyacyl-CoA dehydratase subunit D [Desulfatibacillaceae bacterium]